MAIHISPEHQQLMELNQLDTFDLVWGHNASWFEEPNNRRGGWSGVGRITLRSPQGEMGAYLKRQENHSRRTLRHPISGEPTFSREFDMLNYFSEHAVPAPKLLFFGQQHADGQQRAILMTQELAGYVPLDAAVDGMFAEGRQRPTLAVQNSLLKAAASVVRAMHSARIEHRSLYPKHIFVKVSDQPGSPPEVALIDLEKARFNWFSLYSTYLDLAALTRHSRHWSRTRRMYFYKQYLGVPKLTFRTKWLLRAIVKRSRRGRK